MAATVHHESSIKAVPSFNMDDSLAETRRRQRATVTGGESTLDDDSGYTRPFQAEDQRYVLWNFGNTQLSPRSLMPAVRVLGLFSDKDTALAHAKQLTQADATCSLRLATTHEWYSIPCEELATDRDMAASTAKVNRNLLRHQQDLQDHATEFKTRHEALTRGRTPAFAQAEAAQAQATREADARVKRRAVYEAAVDASTTDDAPTVQALQATYADDMARGADAEMQAQAELHDTVSIVEVGEEGVEETKEEGSALTSYTKPTQDRPVDPEMLNAQWGERVGGGCMPPPVNRSLEVRNQRYAVVSVLPDYETCSATHPQGTEPCVNVWAAFDTEEEALKYNKCVASKQVCDHDLAIVTMYEWLYPHMMLSDGVHQLYRNEELNNIMKHARTSKAKVKDFEALCSREEIKTPVVTIEPDLNKPTPRDRAHAVPVGSEVDE